LPLQQRSNECRHSARALQPARALSWQTAC